MNTSEIALVHDQYVMPTYAPELALVRGKGSWVWDADGKKYLDFLSGISVLNLGHCHPRVVKAIRRQAGQLMHASNLYYNELQPKLARAIAEKAGNGKVFFCNSGAEANEGLIKLARKWGAEQGRHEIITFHNSFHGRTLATLTATGQEKVQKGFEPLPEGFRYARYNELESVKELITDHTAAVLVECIQGEGGVVPADPEFLTDLQELCRSSGILLLVDEVQAGMGRTGEWFAFQSYGLEPDAFALAKGLGNGYPIGAFCAATQVMDVLQPGSHGSTFGGTPLACAAGLAVMETIEKENLLEHVQQISEYFRERIEKQLSRFSLVKNVRGQGLMLGLVCNGPASDLQKELQAQGLLVIATAGNIIRMLPPLTITKREVRKAVQILKKSLDALEERSGIEPDEQEKGNGSE